VRDIARSLLGEPVAIMMSRVSWLVAPVVGLGMNTTSSSYSVLILGDWGGSSDSTPVTSMEKAVISGMAKVAESQGSAMGLLLGDNFYHSGITSSGRFEAGFENAFSTSNPGLNMPFYAIAGNHDHLGNVKVQIDYHQKGSGRWNFPDYDYTIDKTLPDGKKLRICMFDSVKNTGLSHMYDNGTIVVPDGPADLQAASVSWSKLESCLNCDADYLFSAAHYPTYSGCQHGSVMSKTDLPGLLNKYNAHGHLAGHDHCMEHIEKNGQFHVVAGAGSDGWYSYSSISGEKWHISSNNHGSVKGGFAELQFSSSGVKMVYYDDKAKQLYASSAAGPRTPSPSPSPTPSPAGNWDCRTNKKAATGTDTNLKGTGADITSCQQACQETADCVALYWHKTDSHCHVLTGSFSHDKWEGKLSSDSDYDSCYFDTSTIV